MFGFGLRKAPTTTPARADRWHLLGVELNSSLLRAVAVGNQRVRNVSLDAPHDVLPLFVTMDRRTPDVGHAGLAACRVSPHSVCSNFLGVLGQPQEWRGAKLTLNPESAMAVVMHKAAALLSAESDAAALVLPSYLTPSQVRILQELTHGTRWPVRGTATAALAVASHRASTVGLGSRGEERTILLIDADEFAMSATLVNIQETGVRLVDSMAFPKAATRLWKEQLINGLADRCVRLCRRDLRDSAQAEQDLFLQLDGAMDRARKNEWVQLTLRSEHWYQDITLTPEDLQQIVAPVCRGAIDGLKEFLVSAALRQPPHAVWMSEAAARLPGLAARIYKHSPETTQLSLLPATAFAEAAAALVPRWLAGQLPLVHLDTTITHEHPLKRVDTTQALPSRGASSRPALPKQSTAKE